MVRCPCSDSSFCRMLICFSGIVHGEIIHAFLHEVPKLMMIPSIRLVDCQRCLVSPPLMLGLFSYADRPDLCGPQSVVHD